MKYKNARIRYIARGWYITLGGYNYLSKSGEVINWFEGVNNIKNTDHLIMHQTREQAQASLDKYNNPEPTLAEIKEKLSKAKELIGKNIKVLKGNRTGLVGKVLDSEFYLDKTEAENVIGPLGPLGLRFLKENGYVIYLKMHYFRCIYDDGVFEVIQNISVKNHNGEEYFAQQLDKYWQFGCVIISKKLIADSLRLLQTEYLDTNRTINRVTIGAADFDLDTLQKLVDADYNKA